MIQVAYDFPVDRISGPDWLDTQAYDIVATIPMATTVTDFRLMIQNLLAERFKLTIHRGTKEVSGYALEIAQNGSKNGPKIAKSRDAATLAAPALNDERKPSDKRDVALQYMATRTEAFNALVSIDADGFPVPRTGNPMYPPGAGFSVTIAVNGRYRSTALNMPMPEIAAFLGNLAGVPVQDETGLTGKYDIRLEYVPGGVDGAADPGPGVLDAVQEQLGLKLVSKKVPVDLLVIDHAEKVPTGN